MTFYVFLDEVVISDVKLYFGSEYLNSISPYKHERTIKQAIKHPDYDSINAYFDVALIELEESLPIADPRVSPICLPTNSNKDVNFRKHQAATLTGWGSTGWNKPIREHAQTIFTVFGPSFSTYSWGIQGFNTP